MKLKTIAILFLLFASTVVHAANILVPPKEYVSLAKKYSYQDFPKAVDIISIMRVESGFNHRAYNPEISKLNPKRRIQPSVGLMQVQAGSFHPETNVKQGSKILREYYLMFDKNVENAVKAYNIGPRNLKHGKCKISAKDYYSKYLKRKRELEFANSKLSFM